MVEIFILLAFMVVFFFLYERDRKDREREDTIRKTFENTLQGIFTSVEKTNNKFYEMVAKMEIEHFKQLEKSTDKQARFFEKNVDKFLTAMEEKKKEQEQIIERITAIDTEEKNAIEKTETEDNPLEDFDPAMFKDIKHLQFEGEEEIYPIGTE